MAKIEDLKRQIDIEDLAERLGLERPKGKGNWRSPHHDDSTPSLEIKADKGKWVDYSRQDARGDIVDLVAYVNNVDTSDAIRWLHEEYGIPFDRPAAADEPKQEQSLAEFIAMNCRRDPSPAIDYLVSRGISAEVVKRGIRAGAIGWNTWCSPKIPAGEFGHGGPGAAFIVRSLNPGRVVAVDMRYQDPAINGGVKTQSQGEKEGHPWYLDLNRLKRAHTVCIVESAINALSVDTAELPGWAAVATRGTGTATLIDWRWLRGKRVVICMDNDDPNDQGHCPGQEAGWALHELLTGYEIACHLVDQDDWEVNDLNDLLQADGKDELRLALKKWQHWAIPGLCGDFDKRKGKPRVYIQGDDNSDYWRYRCGEAKTRVITDFKKDEDEGGIVIKEQKTMCEFRIAGIHRVQIASAGATMTGKTDHQSTELYSVTVQTSYGRDTLRRKVCPEAKLHNVEFWGQFGAVHMRQAFLRLVGIWGWASHLGRKSAMNFVGVGWREGKLAVNEGPDCFFTLPELQCPYHNLVFPTGAAPDARKVLTAYSRTFERSAALQLLVWALGGHLKAVLGFWPHMTLQARKGAGKSTLTNHLQRTIGFTVFSGQSLNTEFRLLTSIGHTSHPVGWEEISARKVDIIDRAVSMLQESYQYTITRRGAELTEYLLTAPVLLAGEDVPVRSLLGKVVRVQLAKKGAPLTEDLPEFPVRPWLEFICAQQPEDIRAVFAQCRSICERSSRAVKGDDGANRMAGNYAAVMTAWRLLRQFAGVDELDFDMESHWLREMNEHIAETSADREPWVWILETTFAEIDAGNYKLPWRFEELEDQACIALHPGHVMHHMKSVPGLREIWNGLPVKSDRVLRKQLIEAGVVHKSRFEPVIEGQRHGRMLALSLDRLADYGLHVTGDRHGRREGQQ